MTHASNAIRLTEESLVAAAIGFLEDNGWALVMEVGALTRSVDAAGIDNEGRIIAIEFKLRDWRRAVVQAKDHLISCEHVAICMPRVNPSPELRSQLETLGIGYLAYDHVTGQVEMVLPPRRSEIYWEPAGERFAERLRLRGLCA